MITTLSYLAILISSPAQVAEIQLPQPGIRMARAINRSMSDLASGESTMATVRLFVRPDGGIAECEIVRAVGTESVANALCEMVIGFRVGSGTDEESRKAHALVYSTLSVFPDGEEGNMSLLTTRLSQTPLAADLVITLQSLPPALADRPIVAVLARIDENGRVATCQPYEAKRATVSNVACDQAQAQTFEIMKDDEGKRVGYVRSLRVEFVAEG